MNNFTTTSSEYKPNNEPLTYEKLIQATEAFKNMVKVSPAPMKIIVNDLMLDYTEKQYRFPRTRKKRIMKKFKKLYTRTEASPSCDVILMHEQRILICHPEMKDILVKKLESGSLAPIRVSIRKD